MYTSLKFNFSTNMENSMKVSIKKCLIPAVITLAISGCASTPSIEDTPDCVFPDASTSRAPAWVCDAPVEGVSLSAVGYSKKSNAGSAFMKKIASADARVQLASIFKVRVQNMIKLYAQTTGAADAETVDQVNTSVSKLITNETLVGSRLYRSRVSPTGGLFVLIGLDSV